MSAWWWPEVADDDYFNRLRASYPKQCEGQSDEEIHEYFSDGCKYPHTWDHVGDAYEQWEPMAEWAIDALKVLDSLALEYEEARRLVDRARGQN